MSLLPDGAFGDRVAQRLTDAPVVWLTTVGADGTPQPNPVWFLWDGAESVLVYNRPTAHRLKHVAARPAVALNFDGDGQGEDIVVLTGDARREDSRPAAHDNPSYVAKYGPAMGRISGSPEEFGADYSVPLVIDLRGVRGF
jgi:PPOX class probable F420-dependent enzyme